MPPAFPRGPPGQHRPWSWGLRERAEAAGKHLFPTSLQSWGDAGGTGFLLTLPRPPPPTPEVRTGFQAQVQTAMAMAGGATSSSAPTDTTHTPRTDRQTARQTALAGRIKASRSGRGWGGRCFFGYRALKNSSFPGQQRSLVSTRTPHTAGPGRRQLSFPVPPPTPSPA